MLPPRPAQPFISGDSLATGMRSSQPYQPKSTVAIQSSTFEMAKRSSSPQATNSTTDISTSAMTPGSGISKQRKRERRPPPPPNRETKKSPPKQDLEWLDAEPIDGYLRHPTFGWVMHPSFYTDDLTLCKDFLNCAQRHDRDCKEVRFSMAAQAHLRYGISFRHLEKIWGVSRTTIQRRAFAQREKGSLVVMSLGSLAEPTHDRGKASGQKK